MRARLVSVLRPRLGRARRALVRSRRRAFEPVGFAIEATRSLRTAREIATFRARAQVAYRFTPPAAAPRSRSRVVVAVAHVVDGSRDRESATARLAATLDAMLESLADAALELVVHTVPGGHTVDDLPGYLRDRVELREHDDVNPLLVGFQAQVDFADRSDRDWFAFLEDDIVTADTLLLEKLTHFNAGAPPGTVLLPHRYEYLQGERTYVDLVTKRSPVPELAFDRHTVLEIGGWKFAEFANPHSGFYCLSRAQLERWLATGLHWFEKISLIAGRESAATGCLGEAFRLYKPHPDNMTFLMVKHWDTKYARRTEALLANGERAAEGSSHASIVRPD
jgi:hypothetical protein